MTIKIVLDIKHIDVPSKTHLIKNAFCDYEEILESQLETDDICILRSFEEVLFI